MSVAMKAARLHEGATSLRIEEVAQPLLRPGGAIVRVEAAFVSAFTGRLVDGTGKFTPPPRPFTPGMDVIGVVEHVADDVRGLAPGTRVYCNPCYEPRQSRTASERIFIGSFALGPQSKTLLTEWPDGGYAEKMSIPAECAVPIPIEATAAPAALCRLGWLGTAYGALRKIEAPRGAVVAVNGASGLAGAGAVLLALAMGASKVFAIGRRQAALDAVAALDDRIEPVTDVAGLPPIDAVLTCANAETSASIEALLPKLRRRGSLVVCGAPKGPLSLPMQWLLSNDITLRGSSWYEGAHMDELLRLIASGHLDMSAFQAEVFPLAAVNDALERSRNLTNPLRHVALVMG